MSKIEGTYSGTCTNETAGIETAEIRLVLHSSGGAAIKGELTIFGPLEGGSRFEGVFSDNVLTFTTRSHGDKLVITWSGHIVGERIEGTYDVDDRRVLQMVTSFGSLRHQKGKWECQKAVGNRTQ